MWAFTPTSVYLVDSKPGYSATAVGVNTCVRCIAAAITTIFSADVVNALGTGILYSILAGITLLNAGFVIICYIRGYKWRLKFEEKYMPELYKISMANQGQGTMLVDDEEAAVVQDEKVEVDNQLKKEQSQQQNELTINNKNNDEDIRIERVTTQHSAIYSIA